MGWAELPTKLKALIISLSSLALLIIIHAVWHLSYFPPPNHDWIILAVLATGTAPAFLMLPSVNSIIGISDAYIMAVAMLYGPTPCIITAFCHTLSASLFVPNRPKVYAHRVIFNIASMVCGSWLYGNVYLLLNPSLSKNVGDFILPAVVLTGIYFISNSIVTATAISWASGTKTTEFWVKNCLPLAVDFSVSAVSAAFIVSLYHYGRYVPLAAAPLVGVVWGWNKLNKAKAMDAEKHLKEQEQLYLRTVESLALAVDAKDQVTYGHIRRVRAYALTLAKLCGISDKHELMAIETGSLLHDIGKLAVEDYILNKPGPLNKQEFEKMKVHSEAGDEILRQIQFPFPVANYVRFHHERWNGRGYPDGLKAEDIPLGARILAIADTFDAMRSSRPYKLSIGLEGVLAHLKADAGTLYDPHLVDLFIEHIDELEAAAAAAVKNMTELSLRKYFEKIDHQEIQGDPHILASKALQGSAGELIRLAELCANQGNSLELVEILQILAQRIQRLVPFTTCAFYLDSGRDSIKAAYAAGKFSGTLRHLSIGLGKGVSGWVAAYRQPMLNSKPALEFQGASAELTSLVDSLVVPMTAGDNSIGTISLYSEDPKTYTLAHQDLLLTIACIVAPTLAEAHNRDGLDVSAEHVDPVTRAFSSDYLSVAGAGLVAAAQQSMAPLCLLNLEVKNLRQIANLYGPASADVIMGKIADAFRLDLRETDVLVRFGTQGFVALLPGIRQEQALRWAQGLQQRTRSITSGSAPGQGTFANSQIAVASFPQDGSDIFALIGSAQQSLAEQSRSRVDQEEPPAVVGFPPRT